MDWLEYPAAADRVLSMIGVETHWVILQYVLGLSLLAAVANAIWHKTGKEEWLKVSRTLAKAFVIVFAVGAASGTASEFGLVLLWPNLIEAAGKYIYFPLYAEIFAFLMEVVFIYMFYYAWKKLPKRVHVVVGFLAFFGALFSAAMIISVNSYMQAPTGILPAYEDGKYLYDEGYPKLTLFVPKEVAKALDVEKLSSVKVELLGEGEDSVIVAVPVSLVRQLISDAYSGKTVEESVLFDVLNEDARSTLGDLKVVDVIDAIVVNTVKSVGVYSVTFQSPVFLASFMHTFLAALTVSAFTAAAGYALSLRIKKREHAKLGFKFAAFTALLALVLQGTVTGHEMGVAVAKWNPEKFAAIESGTPEFLRKVVAFLAYGDFKAEIPSYSSIPDELKPPKIIHSLYYLKISLAIFLGVSAVYLVYTSARERRIPTIFALSLPVIAQMVSFLGWAVREIGRKPWTIYGIMDVQTAHTINPPSPEITALIAIYLVAILAALVFSVYRFLWKEV